MSGQEGNPGVSKSKQLPDVAFESEAQNLPLAWVGMNEIEIPVQVSNVRKENFLVPARAEVKVRLSTADRGIHMSRLFVGLQKEIALTEVTSSALEKLTAKLLDTQKDLSKDLYIALKFEYPMLQPSLLSHNQGWRTYPVVISAFRGEKGHREFIEVTVTYSSTCPMSAALARQINSEAFAKNFSGTDVKASEVEKWLNTAAGMSATPHAQRSVARVRIEKSATSDLSVHDLVTMIEDSLQTAVQSAVKREDEQEFARRNAQNLMFCEDAARRVQGRLLSNDKIIDFYGEFHHLESLHPHNAVSHIQKSDSGLNSFAIPSANR